MTSMRYVIIIRPQGKNKKEQKVIPFNFQTVKWQLLVNRLLSIINEYENDAGKTISENL